MEVAILNAIQDFLGSPGMDTFMKSITFLGDYAIVWFACIAIMACMPTKRRYALAMLVALVAVFLLGDVIIKPIVERVRPFIAHDYSSLVIEAPTSFSFPSGHSGTSFAPAMVFCLIPNNQNNRWLSAGKVLAVIFACLVAFSRLYLYVHYPTDVLGGCILGLIVGYISFSLLAKNSQGNKEQKKEGGI